MRLPTGGGLTGPSMGLASECSPPTPEGLRAAVAGYLHRLWEPMSGGFCFAEGQPPTLMATAYCVLGLETNGSLAELPRDRRERIVGFLLSGAHPDGSFRDPLFHPDQIATDEHDPPYFEQETTTFCQQALDALAAQAPPRILPDAWLEPERLMAHFDSFPWRNPWLDSNRVMFALAQLCHAQAQSDDATLGALVDAGLDWMDAHQSATTGLWEGPTPVSLGDAMATTFHFSFFYGHRGRPLCHPERIVDSCLSLQQYHGLFDDPEVGHTCLDYDAIDLLAKAQLQTAHRRHEVDACFARARAALLELQNRDGGFAHCKERLAPETIPVRVVRKLGLRSLGPWHVRLPVEQVYTVCWEPLSAPAADSNALSTWFRVLALELAAVTPSHAPPENAPVFRRLPFLGFHLPPWAAGAAAAA